MSSLKEIVESAEGHECACNQSKMSRLKISRKNDAPRNITRASKISKFKQFVQSNEVELKTSLQSFVSSEEENLVTTEINYEIKFVKVKTYNENTDGLIVANYQDYLRLQHA